MNKFIMKLVFARFGVSEFQNELNKELSNGWFMDGDVQIVHVGLFRTLLVAKLFQKNSTPVAGFKSDV